MLRASLKPPQPGAQWTGITTRLAEKLLEAGAVTAVLTMAPDPDDKWKPVPVLVTKAEGMAACRGMRMGYAPLLALLEPAAAAGHKRIAVIGIPCQVYALRALEAQLGLDALYVIGTPCSDNTTTENFHRFLELLSDAPETITYLEFRADYYVELRFADGRKRNAKLIGSDPETDIAVLKIDATDLPSPITLGKMESVQVGDVVLAIGNPFGVGQTVTSGIVSALGRNQLGINTFENFIQTDAAINPGNSGGALVDTKGNLIGINTAIYSRSGGNMGIGFAIPINTAKQVMESILTNGSVTRGWIGVEPQNLSKELAESLNLPKDTSGVLISGVLEGGPADKAGMKPGDVLTQVNSQAVNDVVTLLNRIAQTSPGDEAKINLVRKGKPMALKVQVGKRPKSKAKG
jgi:S1-C subfamily serine protease